MKKKYFLKRLFFGQKYCKLDKIWLTNIFSNYELDGRHLIFIDLAIRRRENKKNIVRMGKKFDYNINSLSLWVTELNGIYVQYITIQSSVI